MWLIHYGGFTVPILEVMKIEIQRYKNPVLECMIVHHFVHRVPLRKPYRLRGDMPWVSHG